MRTFECRTITAKLFGFVLLVTTAEHTFAQEFHIPADSRLHDLPALYQGDVPTNVAGICAQRFSATRGDWDLAVNRFNAKNESQLAELRALQAQILAALKLGHAGPLDIDTWAAVVNARSEQGLVVSYMLAPADDQTARTYCDQARKLFSEEVISADSLNAARVAAAAAIEDLGTH